MTFKTWKSDGTSARYHRTTVLNKIADAMGLEGVKRAQQWIGDREYVSGVMANQAIEYASA